MHSLGGRLPGLGLVLGLIRYHERIPSRYRKPWLRFLQQLDILQQFVIFPRIELEPDDSISDINHYVETKLQSTIDDGLLLEGDAPDKLKIEICDALCKRSRGMYACSPSNYAFDRYSLAAGAIFCICN